MVICLLIEKTSKAKTPLGDFKVTTLKNPLLSQQAVTSKGIPVPYTNIQLNLYPNTQLDLFCSENLSFSMHGFQYVANQLMHRSKYMTNHQLEKDVGCKVLQFISSSTQWRSRSSLVTKPYDIQTQQLLQEKDELEYMSLVTICLWKTFALSCISCDDS